MPYRAISDAGFARFEYLAGTGSPYWWRVYYSDGSTANFGLQSEHSWSYAPLVRRAVDDGGGDPQELVYSYTTVGRTTVAPSGNQPREYVLTQIAYEAPGEDEPYAKVSFHYADPVFCGDPASGLPVGSRLSYRSGFAQLSGTRKLTEVRSWTKRVEGTGFDLRDFYTLGYNAETEACDGEAARDRGVPFRELASVQRRSYRPRVAGQEGPDETVLPATRFTYGKAGSYTRSAHYGEETSAGVANLMLPESVETNQQAAQAYDDADPGTSLPVFKEPFATCVSSFCPVPREPGVTDPSRQPPLSSGAWLLSTGQSNGESVAVAYVDVNGDRQPDLLKRPGGLPKLASANPGTGGCEVEVFLKTSTGYHKSSAFPAFSLRKAMGDIPVRAGTPLSGEGELLCSLNRSFSPDASGGYRGAQASACAQAAGWRAPAQWGSMQQARHGFLDWDGDGRVDLVTQTIASVDCPYASTHGVPAPRFFSSTSEERSQDEADPHWVAEYQDELIGGGIEAPRAITKRQKYMYVYRNTGSGFAETPVRVAAASRTSPTGPQGEGLLHHNIAHLPETSVMAGFAGKGDAGDDQFLPGPKTQLRDINGDGYLDLVFRQRGTNLGPAPRVSGASSTWANTEHPTAEEWRTSVRFLDSSQDPDPAPDAPGQWTVALGEGMQADVNGDGLPDLLEYERDRKGTKVSFNTGFGFASAGDDGQVMFSENVDDTAYLDSFRTGRLTEATWHGYSPIGDRWTRTGLSDLDGDGVADLLFYDREAGRAQLYTGGGRRWVTSHPADADVAQHLAGVVRGVGSNYGGSTQEFDDRADYRYLASHQAIDVNGDGLRDLVRDLDNDGVAKVRYALPVLGTGDRAAPARLMRTMTNGTGATTTVSYGHDAAAGKWVATRITADPGHGQPAITTDYRYLRSAFKAGPYGHVAFRGYGEVHTLRNSSTPGIADDVTHVSRYDYTTMPTGLPTSSATVMGQAVNATGMTDDQPGVMGLATYTYQLRPVGSRAPGMRADYPIYVALPEKTVTHACTGVGGQTLTDCRDNAPTVTRQSAWEPRTVDGALAVFLPTVSETRFVNAAGKTEIHRSTPTFNLAYDNTVYNLAPASTSDSVLIAGQVTDLAQVRYTYQDDDYRYVKTVVVDDANSDVDRVTRLAHHPLSAGTKRGLLHRVWQPEQVHRHNVDEDTDPGYSEVGYDAHGVHTVRVTNPVGHTAAMVVDPASGQALEVRGPNFSCPDGPDAGTALDPSSECGFDIAAGADLTEFSRVHVDGLGRPVKAVSYPIGDVAQTSGVDTFRASYDDLAFERSPVEARVPVSVTVENLLVNREGQDPLYTHKMSTMDGLGRVLRSRMVQDTQVTRQLDYAYNAQGLLERVAAARGDGGIDKTSTGSISLINGYDGLGRVTSIAEQITDANGQVHPADVAQTVIYNGLATTVTQDVDDESAGRRVAVTTDVVGRLDTVEEKWNSFHGNAITRYTYPTPNSVTITDPEGVETTMTHDYSGLRRSVTRAGRTWSYGYDRNGNQTTAIEPHLPGETNAAYTHTIEYDDINRPVKSIPAPRDLTAAEKAEFGFGPTTFAYDEAHPLLDKSAGHANATIGRLTHTSSPVALTTTRFDEWGAPEALDQRLPGLAATASAPGLEGIADTLALTVTTDEAGVPQSARYTARNSGGQTVFTGPAVHATGFDRDGMPTATRVDLGSGPMGIALERNNAGLVVTRRTDTEDPDDAFGYAAVQMRYTHDASGRVTSLQAGAPTDNEPGNIEPLDAETQRYHQTLNYWDNGQVRSITEQLGDTDQLTATTNYDYNHRHELVSAYQEGEYRDGQTGGVGYFAGIDTTAAGRLDYANIATLHPTATPTRMTPRNVTYTYGADNDPLRLKALHVDDGTPDGFDLAAYTYDEAGNTTRRTINTPGGGSTTYTQRWDGPSSLRKVTNNTTGESETYFHAPGGRVAVHRAPDGAITKIRREFGAQEIVYTSGQTPQYRQTVTLAGDTVGRIDGDATTGTFEHYLTSPQGHHVLALDTDGGTQRAVSYGAFGELLQELTATSNLSPNSGDKYPMEFNGKTYDDVSGLHHYPAREYDPLALQWASADPLYTSAPDLNPTDPTRANLYTYTGNNPINRVDPTGLDTCGPGSYCPYNGPNHDDPDEEVNSGPNGEVEIDPEVNIDGEPAVVGEPEVIHIQDDGSRDRAKRDDKPSRPAAGGGGTLGVVEKKGGTTTAPPSTSESTLDWIYDTASDAALTVFGAAGAAVAGAKAAAAAVGIIAPPVLDIAENALTIVDELTGGEGGGGSSPASGPLTLRAGSPASLPPGKYALIIPHTDPRTMYAGLAQTPLESQHFANALSREKLVHSGQVWGVLVSVAEDGTASIQWTNSPLNNGNAQIPELHGQPLESVKGIVREMFGSKAVEVDNIPNSVPFPMEDDKYGMPAPYPMYREGGMWDGDGFDD